MTDLARLRADFPTEAIGKLPRVTCRDCSDKRAACQKHKKQECRTCGAWVSTAHIHLDFIGHATVTDRLLTVDPEWTWEPVAWAADGGPMIRKDGPEWTLWIRLTVGGVTRLGVGSVPAGAFEAEKQLIGDALRNAAMRFGVALSLWSKSELESAGADHPLGNSAENTNGKEAVSPARGGRRGDHDVSQAGGVRVAPAGWDSQAACDAAHRLLADAIKSLPDKVDREPFQAFRQEFGWPLDRDRFLQMEALVAEAAAAHAEPCAACGFPAVGGVCECGEATK